jgi:hypothetical protein
VNPVGCVKINLPVFIDAAFTLKATLAGVAPVCDTVMVLVVGVLVIPLVVVQAVLRSGLF